MEKIFSIHFVTDLHKRMHLNYFFMDKHLYIFYNIKSKFMYLLGIQIVTKEIFHCYRNRSHYLKPINIPVQRHHNTISQD